MAAAFEGVKKKIDILKGKENLKSNPFIALFKLLSIYD